MKKAGITLAVCTILAAAALAQEMPKPGPELKKLDVLTGSWTLDGEMKPGAMGPGGKMTEIQKCEWMMAHFFWSAMPSSKAPWVTVRESR